MKLREFDILFLGTLGEFAVDFELESQNQMDPRASCVLVSRGRKVMLASFVPFDIARSCMCRRKVVPVRFFFDVGVLVLTTGFVATKFSLTFALVVRCLSCNSCWLNKAFFSRDLHWPRRLFWCRNFCGCRELPF